jgi:predicted transcriptional regulator
MVHFPATPRCESFSDLLCRQATIGCGAESIPGRKLGEGLVVNLAAMRFKRLGVLPLVALLETIVPKDLKGLTSEIISSYVSANAVAAADLAALIKLTHAALRSATNTVVNRPAAETKPTASQIRRSITPDALISFVDGRPYTMLRRHLATHGMTPADYRARFGLPADYPVTAPSYSAKRAALARRSGLGKKAPVIAPTSTQPESKGGRARPG